MKIKMTTAGAHQKAPEEADNDCDKMGRLPKAQKEIKVVYGKTAHKMWEKFGQMV